MLKQILILVCVCDFWIFSDIKILQTLASYLVASEPSTQES